MEGLICKVTTHVLLLLGAEREWNLWELYRSVLPCIQFCEGMFENVAGAGLDRIGVFISRQTIATHGRGHKGKSRLNFSLVFFKCFNELRSHSVA